jgi:uncharacterized coiled-coil protein SlyX
MMIDERLDRLVERHEALALSVELLQSTVHEQSGNIDKQTANIDKLISALKIDGENIAALARIAESHERRLSDLEG